MEHYRVEAQVELLKQVRDRVELLNLMAPWKIEEIQNLLSSINWRVEKLKIKADFLDRRFRSVMFARQIGFSIVALILGFPFFVFGLIHNILPYKLTDILILKTVKDIEYYAPMAILLGLVLYPLTYTGFLYASGYWYDLSFWQKVFYFALIPISGMFALKFANYFKHISTKWNYLFLVMNERDALVDLKKQRQHLFDLLFD